MTASEPVQQIAHFGASPTPMLLVDHEAGVIVAANPAAARFYGYARATLIGMPVTALSPSAPELLSGVAADASGALGFVVDHRLASGDRRTVEIGATMVVVVDGRRLVHLEIRPEDEVRDSRAIANLPARSEPGLGTEVPLLRPLGAGAAYDVGAAPGLEAVVMPEAEAVVMPRGPSVTATATGPLPAGSLDRALVLVVDDEAVIRAIAERVLTMAGYRVIVAATGEQALELAAEVGHIDLLFTDVVMPGMHGIALVAALRGERPDLPVLVTSGYTPDDVDRDGTGLAGLRFLPKPYTPADLTNAVASTLDLERAT